MSKIKTATVELSCYSKFRTKKSGMGKMAILEALRKGADFKAYNINGLPTLTYCSISDMAVGTYLQVVEVKGGYHNTVWCGELAAADFIGHTIDIVA